MNAAQDLVKTDRIETREGLVFHISDATLDQADAALEARHAGRPGGCLTPEIERSILLIVGRDAVLHLERKVATLRSDPAFDAGGGQDDRFRSAIEDDRALGVICRCLALRGSSARIDEAKRGELKGLGFDAPMIDRIAVQLRDHARGEQTRTWRLGPTYEQTVGLLCDAAVAPSDANIAKLRRDSLLLLAHILADVERRYERPSHEIATIYGEIVANENPTRRAPTEPRAAERRDLSAGLRSTSYDELPQKPSGPTALPCADQNADATLIETGPVPSLLDLTEGLILKKTTGKSPDWTLKTANQHRSIAKLLVKVAGTDDPRQVSQAHVGKYFTTLATLPKHYGKSSKDEDRPLAEILARAEDLEEDAIGLEAGTVNRHQTQLGNILDHVKGNGFPCGEALASFRRPEADSYDGKRSPFTMQDGQALFSIPVYTGCHGDDVRLKAGSVIIHDALYWIPLIAWYSLLRLGEIAGLLLAEIDVASKVLIVADNEMRRVKTLQSRRRLPIHPELLRLGFMDYVAEIGRLGHKILFPDLRLRGEKTSMGALFYKSFKPALDLALPHAGAQRITLHSTRKTGNTALIAAKVLDAVRYQLMGHQIPGVNGKHYTAPLADAVLLEALLNIPLVTHGVQWSPLRLASGLTNVADAKGPGGPVANFWR